MRGCGSPSEGVEKARTPRRTLGCVSHSTGAMVQAWSESVREGASRVDAWGERTREVAGERWRERRNETTRASPFLLTKVLTAAQIEFDSPRRARARMSTRNCCSLLPSRLALSRPSPDRAGARIDDGIVPGRSSRCPAAATRTATSPPPPPAPPPRSFGASGPRESAPRLGDAPFRADSPRPRARVRGGRGARGRGSARPRARRARG